MVSYSSFLVMGYVFTWGKLRINIKNKKKNKTKPKALLWFWRVRNFTTDSCQSQSIFGCNWRGGRVSSRALFRARVRQFHQCQFLQSLSRLEPLWRQHNWQAVLLLSVFFHAFASLVRWVFVSLRRFLPLEETRFQDKWHRYVVEESIRLRAEFRCTDTFSSRFSCLWLNTDVVHFNMTCFATWM